jgi:hypothetical protein
MGAVLAAALILLVQLMKRSAAEKGERIGADRDRGGTPTRARRPCHGGSSDSLADYGRQIAFARSRQLRAGYQILIDTHPPLPKE